MTLLTAEEKAIKGHEETQRIIEAEGIVQTTEFLASCPEVRLARGPLNLWPMSEVRAVL